MEALALFGLVDTSLVIDVVIFFGFLIAVVAVGIGMSRQKKGDEESSESYFLAGRGLAWWLIGFSLIAANISTEQFVGMSGQAASYLGLAIASYEWIAAVSLVIVAFVFLPRFLKAGVYTIPEFLETRYNKAARTVMSLVMMATLASVNIAVVTYSGAKAYAVFFKGTEPITLPLLGWAIPLDIMTFCWLIGIVAATYVFLGGLKACAWADLIQGSALIICGALILYFALGALNDMKIDAPVVETASAVQAVEAADEPLPPDDPVPTETVDAAAGVVGQATEDVAAEGTAELVAEMAADLEGKKPEAPVKTNSLTEAMSDMDMSADEQAKIKGEFDDAGAWKRFNMLNKSKLRMNLPWTDGILPITALLFGIWIPNLYYWGLNQFIMQRTLGSQSLAQGQKGIVFAAILKLLIPFIVIFPGLIAFNLYSGTMRDGAHEKVATAEKFDEQVQEHIDQKKLFTFDDHFVKFQPEMAARMVAFNAEKMNYTVPEELKDDPSGALKAMKGEFGKLSYFQQPKYGTTFTGYDYDSAFPLLMQRLVPKGGLRGFVLAALLGAIISSLAALFNATSTIFVMDIYKEYIHKSASEKMLVWVGRISVVLIMLFGCWLAPKLADPRFGGVFTFIQEFQGFISPGILAAFLFGFVVNRAPRMCGLTALILNPIIYGCLMMFASHISFLDRMSITFVSIIAVMTLMTVISPLKEPFKQESKTDMDLTTSKGALVVGILVVLFTAALYAYFWDYTTPMFPKG